MSTTSLRRPANVRHGQSPVPLPMPGSLKGVFQAEVFGKEARALVGKECRSLPGCDSPVMGGCLSLAFPSNPSANHDDKHCAARF